MRKKYPYLEDSYFYNTDIEKQKRTVLEDIQNFTNQRQYIKMTLLDWEERPLKEIEGEISSGSISKNGDSPVRRTANLSCAVDARSYSVEDGKSDFAINKKIFIEIGILNETDKYPDYPIFWFPQGVFFIGSFAINSSSTGSTNINLTLKDKMAMLNGDVGGTLPALVIFDSMDTQLPDGSYATKKVLIYNIIKECVNHYGGEDLNNIVIEDVPLRIRRIMRWMGNTPLYMVNTTDISQVTQFDFHFQLQEPVYDKENPNPADLPYDEETNPSGYKTYHTGEDIGYVRDDFVVVDELVGNAGETVVSILDKIKNLLGNYEYFYDVFGIFHFREIKNYLNTTQGEKLLSEMAEKDYLVEVNNERSTFTFSDESILTSITVTPKYENIKNDFIVQGLREGTSSDIAYDIRYHLAIDTKPRPIGVDNRTKITFPKDFSKEIAAGEADLLTLQNKIAEGEQQKKNQQSALNRLNMRKEQRYREVIKYGDLLKRELQLILGDFSLPQDQPIGNLGLDNGFPVYSDWDEETNLPQERPYFYYNEEFWNKYKEDVVQKLAVLNLADNDDFVATFINNSLKYNQYVYENLTPEGFWYLIQTKVLQNLYVATIIQEYEQQMAIWNAALKSVKSNENGYKQITATKIQTPEKLYVYKPIAIDFTDYPTNFYTVKLSTLSEDLQNQRENIKNIYTNYILFLQKKVTQQSNIIDMVNVEQTEASEVSEKYSYISKIFAAYPLIFANIYTFKVSDLLDSEETKNIYTEIYQILREHYQKSLSEDEQVLAVEWEPEDVDRYWDENFRDSFIYLKVQDYFALIELNYSYILEILNVYPEIVNMINNTFKVSDLLDAEETEDIYVAIRQILHRHYMDNLPEDEQVLAVVWEPEQVDEYWNEHFKDNFMTLKIYDYCPWIGSNYDYVWEIFKIYPEIFDVVDVGFRVSDLEKNIYDAIHRILYRHYRDNLSEDEQILAVEWESNQVNEYWNEHFQNIFMLLKEKNLEVLEHNSIFYYSNFSHELAEITKTLDDFRSATENSQNNITSLSGLYDDDSLLKKWEGINTYYKRYQTELINYRLVLKDIEEREDSVAIKSLSGKEIDDVLNTLLSRDYNPYLSSELDTVIEVLEQEIKEKIDVNFDPAGDDEKYEYVSTWTVVIDKLQEIVNNWIKGIKESISNPHQQQKYYGFYETRDIIIYKDPETDTIKAGFSFYAAEDTPEDVEKYQDGSILPVPGNFNLIYKKPNEDKYCYWDGQTYQDLVVKYVFKCDNIQTRYYIYDWRTLLYLQGQYARILGTDAGYYYPELSAFWPRTYDLFNQCFYEEPWTTGQTNDRDLTQGNYFLDFLDSIDTTFGEWSVNNIGRRSDVVVNNEINCLFQPEIPNVNLININSNNSPSSTPGQEDYEQEVYDASEEIPDSLRYLEQIYDNLEGKPKAMYLRAESIYSNEPYTQVDSEIYNNLLTGGYANGAFDQIKYELFLHTRYQKTISMTTIPVFYLEPNSRITIADKTTNTFGDFVIQNISLTLGPGANMSVSTVETIERF